MPRYPHHKLPPGITPTRTLREVGNIVGLSLSRVKQIEMQAFAKMRKHLADNPELRDELEEAIGA